MDAASWEALQPALVAFGVAFAITAVSASICGLVLIVSRHRRAIEALRHQTALEALQRSVALPPRLLGETGLDRRDTDLRNGLVLVGIGAGIIAFAFTLREHDAWGLGLIPLFAGLGYVATWVLTRRGQSPGDHA